MLKETLFLRKVELIVGKKVSGTNAPIKPQDARQFFTRVIFNVEQDDSNVSNKAKIQVYNLSEDSRTFLEQENMVVFLNVGYESGVSNLFFGDISESGITEKRSGPDIITTIECADAQKLLQSANIQIGLGPGASNRQIVNMAASKLNLAVSQAETLPLLNYTQGFSFSGQVKELLNKLTQTHGFKWSIQNGELLILSPKGTDLQDAVVISPETGLIGYPTKNKDNIEFECLINSSIRPGRAAILKSKRIKDPSGAKLKINKAHFEGDSNGQGPFKVKVEGTLIA